MLDYDQINQIASYGGFPVRYPHWRFGMEYERMSKQHNYGLGRIYEMVINNDPCYAYLQRSNSITDQKLVMAHVYAHCDFFKNNLWFSKTNRKMMDGMANHSTRVRKHIERHGQDRVEKFLDVCLSLEHLIDAHSPFLKRTGTEAEEVARESASGEMEDQVTRFASKGYMERFINPRKLIEEERKRLKQDHVKKRRIKAGPAVAGRSAVFAGACAAGAVAAGCAVDRTGRVVLLCAAGHDQGDERGVGDVLAFDDHDAASSGCVGDY